LSLATNSCNGCAPEEAAGTGVPTSVRGTIVTTVLDVDFVYVGDCFDNLAPQITFHLTEHLTVTPIKGYVSTEIVKEEITQDGPATFLTNFTSDPAVIFGPHEIPDFLTEARSVITRRVAKFTAMGWEWVVVRLRP
jgi:hypothetical protein